MKDGNNPIQAGGKLILIDGGYSKAYQKITGVCGCTLTYNSYGLNLITHDPFTSVTEAIINSIDIESEYRFISTNKDRILVKDTDISKEINKEIYLLEMLLYACLKGFITLP